MLPPARSLKFQALFLSAAALLVSGGCTFVPSHQVSIDAISGPMTAVGGAYRLVDKDPFVVREPNQHKLVFACVSAALDTKGIFEAPPGVQPDFTIEVDYGSNRSIGMPRTSGMPATTENFLQLSARRRKTDGGAGKGEEIWNVRTTILEERVDLSTLIPVLAAVSAEYIGQDTQVERSTKVSEKQPNVVLIKSVAQAVAMGRSAP
ncbi:MAG: hypothetical protein ABIO94_11125 [Opitutaceae bacterium]